MKNVAAKLRALLVSFGCRLNQAEGLVLAEKLRAAGIDVVSGSVSTKGPFDLVVVNSCAVTAQASAKSFAALRKLRKDNPSAFLVFCGCAASVEPEAGLKALPFDLLAPNESKDSAAALVLTRLGLTPPAETSSPLEPARESSKTRAYLKIQDGCDNFCAFCIVPFARGRERSVPAATLREEFLKLLDSGYKEIVLTGVNLCAYKDGSVGLDSLVELLLKLPGEFRLRLGSAEPHEILPRLVEIMASDSRLCRFLHMPLQHGSETLLTRMGRHCSASRFAELVSFARSRVPGIHIGADAIVGLPGESDALFAESIEFIRNLKFANLHVFAYSTRPGTRAATMPEQVSSELKKSRFELLGALARKMAFEFAASQVGQVLEVLTERPKRFGEANGWSDNYLKVSFPVQESIRNEIRKVKIIRANEDASLFAESLSK